jgi:hypothetical protein
VYVWYGGAVPPLTPTPKALLPHAAAFWSHQLYDVVCPAAAYAREAAAMHTAAAGGAKARAAHTKQREKLLREAGEHETHVAGVVGALRSKGAPLTDLPAALHAEFVDCVVTPRMLLSEPDAAFAARWVGAAAAAGRCGGALWGLVERCLARAGELLFGATPLVTARIAVFVQQVRPSCAV